MNVFHNLQRILLLTAEKKILFPGSPPIVTISELQQSQVPSININRCNRDKSKKDAKDFPASLKSANYDPNLKRPSPDDPEHKISITDLRTSLVSPKPSVSGDPSVNISSPTSSPANSSPRSMSPVVLSSISTATVSFINNPKTDKKVPMSPLAAAISLSPPSSPSLSLSQISPRSTTVKGPITRFTFGDSSSGTSIDAQTACSPESPRPPTVRKQSSPKQRRDSPSPSKIDNQTKAGEKSKCPGRSSPLSQRAFKQLKWCTTSRKSAGAFIAKRKISREDSMMATLMTSLDQVPELSGHLDMDSTSCSLCSSCDDDPPSLPRGQSPSVFPRSTPASNTPSDSEALPKECAAKIPVHNDDDDDTLGSNSDYTIEGELDDQDEFLPSPSDPSYKVHPELQLRNTDVPSTDNLYSTELPTPCDIPSNCESSTTFLTTNDPHVSDNSFPPPSVQSSENNSQLAPSLNIEITDKRLSQQNQEGHQSDDQSRACKEKEKININKLSDSQCISADGATASTSKSGETEQTLSECCRIRKTSQTSSETLESHIKPDKCQSSSRKSSEETPSAETRASTEVEGGKEENSLPDS